MSTEGCYKLSQLQELRAEATYLYVEAEFGPDWKRRCCRELWNRIKARMDYMAAKGVYA